MDELRHRRSLRRLALFAAICCYGPMIRAEDDSVNAPMSFRSLIAQGWKHVDPSNDTVEADAIPLPVDPSNDVAEADATPSPADPTNDETKVETALSIFDPSHIDPSPIERLPIGFSPIESPPIESPPIESPPIESPPIGLATEELSPTGKSPAMAIEELESLAIAPSKPAPHVPTAQEIRLRESARVSLRLAHIRLQRRATHSAKMYATEALRSIVAMQDAADGGNVHGKELDAALDAIRESQDFGVHFGAVDEKALQRMVAVHETEQLKDRVLDNLSAVEATEAYLRFAEQNLIQAAGGAREASDALTILGRVERETAAKDNAYALAVSVAMQQAAVQIAPESMIAHRELGISLGQQGLFGQSAQSLKRSIAIQPSRDAYQRLLDIARKSGDRETAKTCAVALQSDSLPSEISVKSMPPSQFAATYRPTPASVANSRKVHPENNKSNTEPTRISFRSILPFGRK